MERAGRLGAIQGARALAASLVVTVHTIDAGIRAGLMTGISGTNLAVFGASGVDLFFVISGFVMAKVLAHPDAPKAVDFVICRIQRIMPLFMLVSVAFILINPFAARFSWQSLVYSITVLPLLDGMGYHAPALYVGWTLGVEFAFYALVTLVLATRNVARVRVRILFALASAAAFVGLLATPSWAPARLLFNPLLFEFTAGIALWLASDGGWLARHSRTIGLAGGIVLLLGISGRYGLPFSTHYEAATGGVSGLPRTLDWGLPWAMVLAGLLTWQQGGPVARILARLGDTSYSLYLVHPFALAAVGRLVASGYITGSATFAAAAITGALLLGYLVHALIERPLLHRFSAQRRRRRYEPMPAFARVGEAMVQAARSANTVSPVALTSAKPPSITIVSGSPFSVR